MREDRHMRPNKDALQRTRPSRHCCNPRVSWAGSLSLGRCYVVKSWIMKVLELHPLSPMKSTSTILYLALGLAAGAADAPSSQPPDHYGAQARQVMEHIQKTFWDSAKGIYTKTAQDRTPDYVWRQAAAFSALLGAARHEPQTYRPILARFFQALDVYWDAKVPIPAYEPAPTRGNGHDKYYDDNAWMVITFLEAYELTGDRAYFTRARETARFVLSGWDEKLDGGIWWHQSHKDDSKNACANGPAAVGAACRRYLCRMG